MNPHEYNVASVVMKFCSSRVILNGNPLPGVVRVMLTTGRVYVYNTLHNVIYNLLYELKPGVCTAIFAIDERAKRRKQADHWSDFPLVEKRGAQLTDVVGIVIFRKIS
jgi:hypothetical protein